MLRGKRDRREGEKVERRNTVMPLLILQEKFLCYYHFLSFFSLFFDREEEEEIRRKWRCLYREEKGRERIVRGSRRGLSRYNGKK